MALPTATEHLIETLRDCEEYFDNRADADHPAGDSYPTPNEEMKMLAAVRQALSFAEKLNRNGVRA